VTFFKELFSPGFKSLFVWCPILISDS